MYQETEAADTLIGAWTTLNDHVEPSDLNNNMHDNQNALPNGATALRSYPSYGYGTLESTSYHTIPYDYAPLPDYRSPTHSPPPTMDTVNPVSLVGHVADRDTPAKRPLEAAAISPDSMSWTLRRRDSENVSPPTHCDPTLLGTLPDGTPPQPTATLRPKRGAGRRVSGARRGRGSGRGAKRGGKASAAFRDIATSAQDLGGSLSGPSHLRMGPSIPEIPTADQEQGEKTEVDGRSDSSMEVDVVLARSSASASPSPTREHAPHVRGRAIAPLPRRRRGVPPPNDGPRDAQAVYPQVPVDSRGNRDVTEANVVPSTWGVRPQRACAVKTREKLADMAFRPGRRSRKRPLVDLTSDTEGSEVGPNDDGDAYVPARGARANKRSKVVPAKRAVAKRRPGQPAGADEAKHKSSTEASESERYSRSADHRRSQHCVLDGTFICSLCRRTGTPRKDAAYRHLRQYCRKFKTSEFFLKNKARMEAEDAEAGRSFQDGSRGTKRRVLRSKQGASGGVIIASANHKTKQERQKEILDILVREAVCEEKLMIVRIPCLRDPAYIAQTALLESSPKKELERLQAYATIYKTMDCDCCPYPLCST